MMQNQSGTILKNVLNASCIKTKFLINKMIIIWQALLYKKSTTILKVLASFNFDKMFLSNE